MWVIKQMLFTCPTTKPTFSWSLFINSTSMAFSLTDREREKGREREREKGGGKRRQVSIGYITRANGVWLAYHDRITLTDGR